MNSKTNPANPASGGDIVKYVIAALLVLGGLFVWYWFSTPANAARLGDWAPQLRGLAVVAGLVAGTGVFLVSSKGREAREFLSESRFELRKVVWPTRQETTRTMWVVIAVVILMSLMLAGMDLVIQAAVKWLLGNG